MDNLLPIKQNNKKPTKRKLKENYYKEKRGRSPQKHTQTQNQIENAFNILLSHAEARYFLLDTIH